MRLLQFLFLLPSGCGGLLTTPGHGHVRRLSSFKTDALVAVPCLWRLRTSVRGAQVVAKLKTVTLGPSANCPTDHFVRFGSVKLCNEVGRAVVGVNGELEVEFRLSPGSKVEVEYSGESSPAR